MEDRFALFIAVVNRVPDRDSLIRELAESLPDLSFRTVRLKADTTDPLDEVLRQAGDPPPGPVMVVDFDAALPSDAAYHPILQALNLRRPEWPKIVPRPVIFWVPEYVLALLAREAVDFLDWRSITAFFTDSTEQDLVPFRSELWNGGLNSGYTRLQRLARIAELESRLALYERDEGDRQALQTRAAWLNELGLHHQYLGEPSKAIGFFREALVLAHRLKNPREEGAALGNLGIACADLGDTRTAIAFHEQHLAIAQKIGDLQGEGNALGNLGIVHAKLGDSRTAINYFERRLTIARKMGDRRGEGNALGNLGAAYTDLGDARAAVPFYEKHLAIAREVGDRRGEGNALGNLGFAHRNLGDARAAIAFYEKHLAIAREIGDQKGEASANWNTADALLHLGENQAAIPFAEQALAYFESIGHPCVEADRKSLAELRASTPPTDPT